MLEWVTAAQTKANPQLSMVGFYRQMAGGVTLGHGCSRSRRVRRAEFLADRRAVPDPLAVVARHRAMGEPAVSWRRPTNLLPSADTRFLRLIARRTWRFFETFVTAEDHMLPPDNFQEEPMPVVAHRTSPTNIGLYLSSVVAASDFGWLGMTETVERLEATLETMNSLERCRGTFLQLV